MACRATGCETGAVPAGGQGARIASGSFPAGAARFPARLSPYYLALHPVTNAQYMRFVDKAGCRPGDFAGIPASEVILHRDGSITLTGVGPRRMRQ